VKMKDKCAFFFDCSKIYILVKTLRHLDNFEKSPLVHKDYKFFMRLNIYLLKISHKTDFRENR